MGLEDEFERISSSNSWNLVFRKILNDSIPIESAGTFEAAMNNRTLNRYRNVVPYDYNRITLEDFNVDYINASLIFSEELPNQKYIFTQGPLDTTASHFWLMIWQQKCAGIVMLNRIFENGAMKCFPYFPYKAKEFRLYNDVNLRVECVNCHLGHSYVHRIMRITETKSKTTHEVDHFNFSEWPDFDVPKNPKDFLDFLFAVWATGCIDQEEKPSVVHCSAGIGRSGTFALIDICVKMMKKQMSLDKIDVKKIMLDLRRCRPGVIQSPEQLRFCYRAILAASHRILKDKHSHEQINNNNYEKMSTNVKPFSESDPRIDPEIIQDPQAVGKGDESFTDFRSYVSNDVAKVTQEMTPQDLMKNFNKKTNDDNDFNSDTTDDIDGNEMLVIKSQKSENEKESREPYGLEMENLKVRNRLKNHEANDENTNGSWTIVDKEGQNNSENNYSKPSNINKSDPIDYLKMTRNANESDFPSKESFASLTDYYVDRMERRMKSANIKMRRRKLPLLIRRPLERLLVHSGYIKSTGHFLRLLVIASAILVVLFGFYVKNKLSPTIIAKEAEGQ